MKNGREKFKGSNVSAGIDNYYKSLGEGFLDYFHEDADFKLFKVSINGNDENLPLVKRLDDLTVSIDIEINSDFESAVSSLILFDHGNKSVGICINEDPINNVGEIVNRYEGKTRIILNVKIPRINLSKGIYYVTFIISETPGSKPLARLNNIKAFQVTSKYDVWPPLELEGRWYKKSDTSSGYESH